MSRRFGQATSVPAQKKLTPVFTDAYIRTVHKICTVKIWPVQVPWKCHQTRQGGLLTEHHSRSSAFPKDCSFSDLRKLKQRSAPHHSGGSVRDFHPFPFSCRLLNFYGLSELNGDCICTDSPAVVVIPEEYRCLDSLLTRSTVDRRKIHINDAVRFAQL